MRKETPTPEKWWWLCTSNGGFKETKKARTRKLRTMGMKLPWQMSTKTVRNATNVVRLTIKETNACTERRLGATEIMVTGTRTMEGIGNPRERDFGASAIIATRAVTKKKTAGRSTQN